MTGTRMVLVPYLSARSADGPPPNPPTSSKHAAPSPTAAAINLLNLLKVANMSHNLYNPYSPESQDSSSGAYQPPSAQSGEYESRNAEYSQAGYTCESAMDILKRFNLQEEDLEELCAYTEDQLSPANLPYLLRDIRQKKAKRSSSASQSSMVHHAQGSQRITETTAGPRANVKREEEVPPAFQQPSKVIEYGHTSKYTGGFREEDEGRGHHNGSVRPSSFSESGLMDSYTSQSRETLPKDVPPPASDASLQRPPPAKPAGKRTPTAAMISDYMGVTPKLFPHTCCLCNKPCVGVKVKEEIKVKVFRKEEVKVFRKEAIKVFRTEKVKVKVFRKEELMVKVFRKEEIKVKVFRKEEMVVSKFAVPTLDAPHRESYLTT
ncbi:unnamed protein product [Merluccius merluccius]